MNITMEKSSFRLVFGDSPIIRVIDFFLDHREFDYSLTEIAKGAGVGWVTLHQFWKELVRLGLVKRTRRIGRAELYRLNEASPIVKKLSEVDLAVSKVFAKRELAKQTVNLSA